MDAMECDNCGATMRWETSHSRCDRCGYIRPCCEGAPVTAGCVVPTSAVTGSSSAVTDEHVPGVVGVTGYDVGVGAREDDPLTVR